MTTKQLKHNSGVALILVIGILTILLMVGLTVIQTMRVEEKTADSYFTKLGSLYFAKSGFDHAVYELKVDTTDKPNELKVDAIDVPFSQSVITKIYDNRWRAAFVVSDATFISNNPNLVTRVDPIKYPATYSRWYYIKRSRSGKIVLDHYNYSFTAVYGAGYETIGRYAILVTDECGKINVNVAGDTTAINTFGHSDFELRLIDVLGEANGVSPQNAAELATDIVQTRYGAQNTGTQYPGDKDVDENENNDALESDGIDNDGDGDIDEGNEGFDEPSEFFPEMPFPDTTTSDTKRDQPFKSIYDLLLISSFYDVSFLTGGAPATAQKLFDAVSPLVTTDSKSYNQFYCPNSTLANVKWLNKISVNAIPSALRLLDALQESKTVLGIPINDLRQTCANIVDFYDYDLFPTHIFQDGSTTHGFYGVESIRINEIGKLSGHVLHGYDPVNVANQPVTISGGWARVSIPAPANQLYCTTPNQSAQCSYSISVPLDGNYVLYVKSAPKSGPFDVSYEGGAASVSVAGGALDGRWAGTVVPVTGKNIEIVVTDKSLSSLPGTQTAVIDYFLLTNRYVEFINLSNREIPVDGMQFSPDGGFTKYTISSTQKIPKTDFAAQNFGYLVLTTNAYSFEKVWESAADHDGSLDDYRTDCGNKVLVLSNTSMGQAVEEDWGIAPGANPLGPRPIDPILYAPINNAAPPAVSRCAWDFELDRAQHNKIGWMQEPNMAPHFYNNYNRERISAVSDKSTWEVSSGTFFLNAKNNSHQLGTPGRRNDNTKTSALPTAKSENNFLWKCLSMPAANFSGLTNVTVGSDYNTALLYDSNWEIDVTGVLCINACKYEAESFDSRTGSAWVEATPNPKIEPFKTDVMRGTAQTSFTWNSAATPQTNVILPGTYSMFIAGNYKTNNEFRFTADATNRHLNASNIYSVDGDDADKATTQITTRQFSLDRLRSSSATNFDFDYVLLSPQPYEYGKINVNTASLEALYALKLGGLTDADINNIHGGRPYVTIGEVASQLTREKWGLISRYITVRSDVFEITVVGQSIRDKNPGDLFDPTIDKVGAMDKIIGIVDRSDYRQDTVNGKIKVLNYRSE